MNLKNKIKHRLSMAKMTSSSDITAKTKVFPKKIKAKNLCRGLSQSVDSQRDICVRKNCC